MSQQEMIEKTLKQLHALFPSATLKDNCLYLSKTVIAPAISFHKIINKIRVNIYNLDVEITEMPATIKTLVDISSSRDFEYKVNASMDGICLTNLLTVRMDISTENDSQVLKELFTRLTLQYIKKNAA